MMLRLGLVLTVVACGIHANHGGAHSGEVARPADASTQPSSGNMSAEASGYYYDKYVQNNAQFDNNYYSTLYRNATLILYDTILRSCYTV